MGHAETCSELKNIFAALVKQSKPPESSLDALDLTHDSSVDPEVSQEPVFPRARVHLSVLI